MSGAGIRIGRGRGGRIHLVAILAVLAATIPSVCAAARVPVASHPRVSGENVWLGQTRAGLSGAPAIVDNAVIVGAGDSGLYVYTPFALPMI